VAASSPLSPALLRGLRDISDGRITIYYSTHWDQESESCDRIPPAGLAGRYWWRPLADAGLICRDYALRRYVVTQEGSAALEHATRSGWNAESGQRP
jgi:hypothetical protein